MRALSFLFFKSTYASKILQSNLMLFSQRLVTSIKILKHPFHFIQILNDKGAVAP